MSKKIECRLPDELYARLKEYVAKEGETVTDIVIAGINGQIRPVNEIVRPGASGETVYIPDPVKPAKAPKVSTAAPIVKAMLSGISKQSTVSHHPTCKCGICSMGDKVFFNPQAKRS